MHRDKRTRDDALASLKGYNAATDPRHVRRELTPEEMLWLVATTETRTLPEHKISGPDRAMAYRLAFGTGFRAKELRSLAPESFDLDADLPTVAVQAAHSKRRREDCQPIRRDLADLLRSWLSGRPAGQPVFSALPQKTARMLRADLRAARATWIDAAPTKSDTAGRKRSDFLLYEDASGRVADFHATRHTYVSAIVAGGASVKTAQELARHSTSTLTIGRYSHARLHDLQGALDALPSLTPGDAQQPKNNTLLATGTENTRGSGELDCYPKAVTLNPGAEGEGTCGVRKGAQLGQQLGGETVQAVASGGEKPPKPSEGADKAQVLTLPRNKKRRQVLATDGEKYP